MVPFCSFDTILSKEDFNYKQNVIMNAIKFFMLHIVLSYHTRKIFDLSYCCDICLQFCVRVESYHLSIIYNFHFGVKKCHFYNHLESWLDLLNNCWKLITLQSYKQNWPQELNTNMVIIHCTLIMTEWMIHHFNQRVTADVKRYHTWL